MGFGFATGLVAAGGLSDASLGVDESLSAGEAAFSESAGAAALSEAVSAGASFGLGVSDGAGVVGVGAAGAGVAAGVPVGGVAGAAVVGCDGAAALGCGGGCDSVVVFVDGGGVVVVSGAVEFCAAAEGFFDGFSHASP